MRPEAAGVSASAAAIQWWAGGCRARAGRRVARSAFLRVATHLALSTWWFRRGGTSREQLPVKGAASPACFQGGARGLKADPPLDPPRPSIISPFHPPGQVPRIARGTLERGVVLGEAWSARYGVGLRPSFQSGSLGEALLVLLHGKPLGEALV